jgi:AraC family transcriptional regulator
MQRQLRSEPPAANGTKCRQVAGVSLGETSYPPRLRMGRHGHDLAAFGFVLGGTYAEKLGSRWRKCAPGSLVFHPPGEEHAVEFHDEPVQILRVDFPLDWLTRVGEHTPVLRSPTEFRGGRTAELARRLHQEFQETDSAAPLAMQGLILEILSFAARRSAAPAGRRPPGWLNQAHEMIRDRFADTLSLDAIAKEVAIHPAHLAREYRRTYGCSIGEAVRRLRVEYARRALSTSTLPLATIAAAAGFSDQSHFTRIFRSITGLTPLAFRKRIGGRNARSSAQHPF